MDSKAHLCSQHWDRKESRHVGEGWPGLALRLWKGEHTAKATLEWETQWTQRARHDPVDKGSQGKFLGRVEIMP